MFQADTYFSCLLETYKKMKKEQQRELRSMPPGQLSIRKDGKHTHYVHLYSERGRQIRRGITKDREMIRILARKKYLQKSLALLEKDITLLETFMKKHRAPTPDNIIKHLPEAYSRLMPEDFLPQGQSQSGWAAEPFEKSTWHPEELSHITGRGLVVRSKSEAIIADKLDHYKLPFRYEEILYIENKSFAPDFKILSRNGIVYWEHCGRVHDKKYMRKHNWKISMYEKAGIVPWKNLIVTYDDEQGRLDIRIIESEIKNKLL